jgi:GGDEF domain-containing protein
MITLERSVFFLIIYLTIFFNIERVDLGQENFIDISSILYVLVLVVLLLILAFPIITRMNLATILVLWVVFYLGIRLAILPFYPRAIWGGIYTYLTITEISLSAIAVILVIQVRRQLTDFRQAVENLTLAGLTHRIQHRDQAIDDIQKEFLRTRRHRYNLSVLVVQPDPSSVKISLNRSVLETQRQMMTRYATTNIMRLASNMFRRTDLIVDQVIDKDSFVILLTDTDPDSADEVAKRFQTLVDNTMGVKINIGLAAFPDEGLTFDELVNKADQKIQNRPIGPGDNVNKKEEVNELQGKR